MYARKPLVCVVEANVSYDTRKRTEESNVVPTPQIGNLGQWVLEGRLVTIPYTWASTYTSCLPMYGDRSLVYLEGGVRMASCRLVVELVEEGGSSAERSEMKFASRLE